MRETADALQSLPHGPEFRFLDRIDSLDPGRAGVGWFTVPREAPYLRGHFPGAPLFPGVLLIEAAAQLAGAVAQTDPQAGPLENLKLTAVRQAKIAGSALPEEQIRIEARILGRLGGLIQAEASARVGDRLVLETELTLSGDERKHSGR